MTSPRESLAAWLRDAHAMPDWLFAVGAAIAGLLV
jgi:hypothetical protein